MKRLALGLLILAAGAAPAAAHPAEGHGFAAGFIHPLTGLDHLLAILAIGAWAGVQGGAARYLWPGVFALAMLASALLARAGLDLPLVEPMILASLVVFGLAVAFWVKAPALVGAAVVVPFALAHGYAHGAELGAAEGLPLVAGMVAATALLLMAGAALGAVAANSRRGQWLRYGLGLAAIGVAVAGAVR